ncbi:MULTISPECIES: hypothetical protein [Aquimarina]|uniref:YcxB family protein n=1 Tax=Aquimarina algiphila TaxID=2047982 RepID=A0A554VDL2_9FLAO|nr:MULTISPECIES: hypothetical protein [Aquimarina]TSE04974.1 hypothetical protein FOF46_24420 [Aquimarina algiphila]
MSVTKTVTINFYTILKAKVYNFINRSIIKYIIASILIAIVNPNLFGSMLKTAIGITLIIIFISLIIIVLSAKIQSNRLIFNAVIEFNNESIAIHHVGSKQKPEYKNWDWITSITEKNNEIWLKTNETRLRYINFNKKKLTVEELDFFRKQMKKYN